MPKLTHEHYMRRALELGAAQSGRTAENPAVGCVLVKDGDIIGEGATQDGGRPHAETVALQVAGRAAEGATAYVTLEPCSHYGQTAPCANALIEAGVARCFIAAVDPDPRVNWRGAALLQEAGIDVRVGLCEVEAKLAHKAFFARVGSSAVSDSETKIEFKVSDNLTILADELRKPFVRISINYGNNAHLVEKERWVNSVTLWDADKMGLRILPFMTDVAKRVEVGSFSFERVTESFDGDVFFALDKSFSEKTSLKKIIVKETNHIVETGFVIFSSTGAQILIVPNAMPYTLAIRCEGIGTKFFEPEYSLGWYEIADWN